jgi:hypothetical protein
MSNLSDILIAKYEEMLKPPIPTTPAIRVTEDKSNPDRPSISSITSTNSSWPHPSLGTMMILLDETNALVATQMGTVPLKTYVEKPIDPSQPDRIQAASGYCISLDTYVSQKITETLASKPIVLSVDTTVIRESSGRINSLEHYVKNLIAQHAKTP